VILSPKNKAQYKVPFKKRKHLNFDAMVVRISTSIKLACTPTSGTTYHQHDIAMGALACMFFQSPSLLEFQRQLDDLQQKNNLFTLFNMTNIPEDSQLRERLDNMDSEIYRGIFNTLFEQMRRDKALEQYRLPIGESGLYYVPIDGSTYHSSSTISCDCCLTQKHTNGTTTYKHSVLQGAIVRPGIAQIIPLFPEAIKNTDGHEKQDCEQKAAKRFLEKLRQDHPRLPLLIGGDDLFSRTPIFDMLKAHDMHGIFTCKAGSHTHLYSLLDTLESWPWHSTEKMAGVKKPKKETRRYRWYNQLPLNSQPDAPLVNVIEYQILNELGNIVFKNVWVTNVAVDADNVTLLIEVGRSRWKIENECFNSLKNQGYHMEHNFGHGKKHLSFNMYLSILLAFFMHQILELTDAAYQACRKKFGSKKNLWNTIRTSINLFVFPQWYWLMDFILEPDGGQFKIS
jgi:hypothetical protein